MPDQNRPQSKKDIPEIHVHWLNDSRAQRLLFLLEALSLPYKITLHTRDSATRLAPASLKAIHPLGKAPVVTIANPNDVNSPLVLAESAFIFEYLCEHFGDGTGLVPGKWRGEDRGVGSETEEWMRFRFLMHFAEGSFMSTMLVAYVLTMLKSPTIPFLIRPITGMVAGKFMSIFAGPTIHAYLAHLENMLVTAPGVADKQDRYLCGPNLTAADILLTFPLFVLREQGRDVFSHGQTFEGMYPNLNTYVALLEGNAAYKRSLERVKEVEAGGKGDPKL